MRASKTGLGFSASNTLAPVKERDGHAVCPTIKKTKKNLVKGASSVRNPNPTEAQTD